MSYSSLFYFFFKYISYNFFNKTRVKNFLKYYSFFLPENNFFTAQKVNWSHLFDKIARLVFIASIHHPVNVPETHKPIFAFQIITNCIMKLMEQLFFISVELFLFLFSSGFHFIIIQL
ncbi:unnamed protein product [Moneuplotes crassus]|uniref:Uncharacterized protein n=1 Tax=Euplotes crassus TaxID=5936 RepID=A0AAD1XX69_EUPCR|nr:unnamed protein product [Moneuplotes crassus]